MNNSTNTTVFTTTNKGGYGDLAHFKVGFIVLLVVICCICLTYYIVSILLPRCAKRMYSNPNVTKHSNARVFSEQNIDDEYGVHRE